MKIKYLGIVLVSGVLLAGCAGATSTPSSNNATNPASSNTNTTNTSSNTNQTFTLVEVQKHNQAGDCWMVIDKQVYDVTPYVDLHPGGPSIVQGCGKDATSLFNSQPKHAGSKIQNTLNQYLKGPLKSI